jgi:hypothetical protein
VLSHARQQRCGREQAQTGEQDTAAAQQVRHPATDQEKSAE